MLEPTSIVKVAATAADEVIRIYSLFDMGKSLIDIYKDKHNTLKDLFIRAFKQAVDDVSKQYTNYSTKSFLEKCREIEDAYGYENLDDYLHKINNDMGVHLNDNDMKKILDEITEQLNCIVLNDNEYKDLYNVFSYYQLNSISFKLNELDNIIQEFIKLIDDYNELRSDNELFARAYKERLFMHAVGDISISLSDILVMPNVIIGNNDIKNALEAIRDFVNDKNQHVFFLEGFGGYGKSSIVSYLAYNYLFNRLSPNIDFLDDRQLVIIRLRDIDSNNIIKGITDKLNNIGKLSKSAVLVFDGLDELCLIENKSDGNSISENIVYEFLKDNRKIIITSRPTYIRYEELKLAKNIKKIWAEIMAFDEEKRKQFVDLFACKDSTNPLATEYLKMPIDDRGSIYGSPFLLYLIMSGGIEEDERDNSWKLLYRIFHEEIFKPQYNLDIYNVRQLNEEESDKIYQYNCDIAYEMFKTQNQKLSFTYDELSKLLPDYNSEEYVKKSHGLFSYMRYNNGAVEFVHNHVRDFFLCEKLLREIKEWYLNEEIDGYQIVLKLEELLKYTRFNDEVKVFFHEALECDVYKMLIKKVVEKPISYVFDWFFKSGGIVKYDFQSSNNCNYIIQSMCVLSNSAFIYHKLHEKKLGINNDKYISWFSDYLSTEDIAWHAFLMIKDYLSSADLHYADFRSLNLSFANLNKSNLAYANLDSVDLTYSNLCNSNLFSASLKFSNLHKASLRHANLCVAYLYGAYLCETNLSEADLREAKLSETYFKKANLSRANFSGADLRGADLRFAENISEAIFKNTVYNENTIFPEGFIPQEPEWHYMK